MKSIYLWDLKREFKSVKAFVIASAFISVSLLIAKYSHSLELLNNGESPAISILFAIYAGVGFLFSGILFSDIITKEVSSQTFRYLIPYISRKKIIIAKFFTMMSYFISIIFLAITLLFLIRGDFYLPYKELFSLIIFFAYVESIILLVSILSNSERLSSLICILISIISPIIYGISTLRNDVIFNILNWFLPYRYLESDWTVIFLIILTVLIFTLNIYLFERKEL